MKYPNGPGDVLDRLLTHIVEGEIELVAHLVAHDPADADSTGFGQGFKPRCDIDAIAENVPVLYDDVAEIDADTNLDALIIGNAKVAHDHLALHLNGAPHGIDNASKLDQHPISGRLNDAALVLVKFRVDQLAPQRAE
ncbi:MAG TPA: hypothetical protein VN326_13665 [Casimicrobiaceae bacterium]|nr:hypothetical protein [Casimicrobiaceae bacterium]